MVDTVAQDDPQAEALAAAQGPRLAISGVVLSKAQLLEVLRVRIPNAADITPAFDGAYFSVLLAQPSREHQPPSLG
ncbi:MAG: hypothetical protein HYY02_13255 [Chloroflexi bacterium]|nr:hypothetical protein [Chloroflexota bacterium]